MEFLFKPGDVLVWEEKNDIVAAITSSWPTVRFKPLPKSKFLDLAWKRGYDSDDNTAEWTWQVRSWQYYYDGAFQRRNQSTIINYYEGIMVLTSNRVGTFDEAFKSRIQLSLHYENLTEGQRKKIWKNFLNRLKGLDADLLASSSETGPEGGGRTKLLDPTGIDFDDVECYLDDLAKYELNGRQIRNAITTARQLAKFKNEKMSFHHLVHVITVSGKFDTYLKNVKECFTDDQVARGGGIR